MNKVLGLTLAIAMLSPLALHADTITGQFSIGGSVTPSTTTLTFDAPTIVTSMNTQSGDFIGILGNAGGVHATNGTPTITFSPTYPGGAFLEFPDLTILIESISAQQIGTGPTAFTLFSGTTIFESAGFDNTNGTFSFTTQGSGEVSFSATGISNISSAPEPSSIALLGTAALAGAGVFRKRLM